MKQIHISSVMAVILSLSISMIAQSDLNNGLDNLSQQITSEMSGSNKQKIAVAEFSDLDGNVTELGKYLSEELITRLFISRKFNVIERQLLNRVLEEHKLKLSGLVDETTAKELGKILGVDAICSGTITDLVYSIKVNARLISSETGSVFAVASTEIQKDDVVRKLMGNPIPKPKPGISYQGQAPSGNVFFAEDFSAIPEGEFPPGWTGGEKLLVKSDGRTKYLGDFEKSRSHSVTTPSFNFPNDFELEYVYRFGGDWSGTQQSCYVGSVRIQIDVAGWLTMNNTKGSTGKTHRNQTVRVRLRKESATFRLFVDGAQVAIARYPDFTLPNALTFEFKSMTNFRLERISVKPI